MSKKIFLSIITVTYNDFEGFLKTYNSIKHLLNENIEWIIKDGGSDNSIIKRIENLLVNKKIKFISSLDNGTYNAMNTALNSASGDWLIFMNGGDRTKGTIPEMEMSYECDVDFKVGVGGKNKANSSSWILEDWKAPKTERPWGWYRVLDEGEGGAVKELTILPGKSLSDQKHLKRSEHWHVVQGEVTIQTEWMGVKRTDIILPTQSFDIGKEVWHKPSNKTKAPAKIIETWFGDELTELDIERR